MRHQWTNYQAYLCSQLQRINENENDINNDADGDGQNEETKEASLMKDNVRSEGEDAMDDKSEDDESDENCQESEDDNNTGGREKKE